MLCSISLRYWFAVLLLWLSFGSARGQETWGLSASSYLGGSGDDDGVFGVRIASDGTLVLAANIGNAAPGGLTPVLLAGATASSGGAIVRLSVDGRTVLSVTRFCGTVYDLALGPNDEILVAAGTDGVFKLNATATAVLWQALSGTFTLRLDAGAGGHVAALCPSQLTDPWGTGRVYLFTQSGLPVVDFPGRYNTQDVCVHEPSQTVVITGYRVTSTWEPASLLPVHIA